jgi:hypothetical protein
MPLRDQYGIEAELGATSAIMQARPSSAWALQRLELPICMIFGTGLASLASVPDSSPYEKESRGVPQGQACVFFNMDPIVLASQALGFELSSDNVSVAITSVLSWSCA